ncbi:restriction endonuclease subunit S [Collinsella intestinalis]|uniref:restriction endonuclease subunit S n=1 Tax=Collinsella intestinalis TaxID=147207 RepID=UPI0034677DE3
MLVPQRDKPREMKGETPWCRIEDIEGPFLNGSKSGKGVSPAVIRSMNLKVNPVGTVLCSNSATIGVPAIVTKPLVTNQRFIGFVCSASLYNWYLYYLFLANHSYLSGAGTGTTQSYIARSTFETMLIPLPPLAEQRRIVERVDQLLPLVEEYGELEDAREKLDGALPARLRKSVLQMAVQGKLAPQDPADEPASALLERIREQRRLLVAEKRMKAPKGGESVIFTGSDGRRYEKRVDAKGRESEPVCIEDEIPFEIPGTWEWARLGSIVCNRGQKKPTSDFCYIDISSIDSENQKLGSKIAVLTAAKAPSRARKIVTRGDVLYATVRPYLHNACVIDRDFKFEPIASTGFAALSCPQGLDSYYLLNYLVSPRFDEYANDNENSKGVAYPAINDARLYRALVPIPPISEQRRIVEKLRTVLTNQ